MDSSVMQALQMLWGSSEAPVCAVSRSLEPVWAPDDRFRPLLRVLRTELLSEDQTAVPVFPQDGTVLFDAGGSRPCCCTVLPLAVPGEELYLLRFPELPEDRHLTPAETRLLLREQTDLSRYAVANIMQSLYFSESSEKAGKKPDLQALIHEAEDACYALLNGCQHCEEMLWYAFCSPLDTENTGVQDLRMPLRQFADRIAELTAGSLRITECLIEPGLYARTDPARFSYALMLMFLTTHGGAPELNEMKLLAEQRDGSVRIRLSFSSGEQTCSVFRRTHIRNISLTNNELLLGRFCRTFGAVLNRGEDPARPECTLSLPAADPGEGALPLSSSKALYSDGSFSEMHILLSEIMRAADFPHPD